jgi:hypothetical protein
MHCTHLTIRLPTARVVPPELPQARVTGRGCFRSVFTFLPLFFLLSVRKRNNNKKIRDPVRSTRKRRPMVRARTLNKETTHRHTNYTRNVCFQHLPSTPNSIKQIQTRKYRKSNPPMSRYSARCRQKEREFGMKGQPFLPCTAQKLR